MTDSGTPHSMLKAGRSANNPSPPVCDFCLPSRKLPWLVLVVFVVYRVLFPVVLFSTVWTKWFLPFCRMTGWLVNPTLVVYAVDFVILAIMFVWWSGLRQRDLGLDWTKLKTGATLTVALWISANFVFALISLLKGEPVTLYAKWSELGASMVFGILIGQLLGNALYEGVSARFLHACSSAAECSMFFELARRIQDATIERFTRCLW